MDNFRKVEIKKDDSWTQIDFWKIKDGDIFRLFEPTGEPVEHEGQTEFSATSDSYLKDGIWQVDT